MKISPRDWAKLSAFLDDELSPGERRKFEARLASQPALQSALDDLRRTKAVLGFTPQLEIPRSFTLTPEMVGRVPKRSPARGYQWAAAALSFLFIAVVVVDLGSGALRGGLSAAVAPRSEVMMQESAPEEGISGAAADEVEEPALLGAEEAPQTGAPEEEAAEMAPEAEAELAAEAPTAAENLQGEDGLAEEAEADASSGTDRSGDESMKEGEWQDDSAEESLPTAASALDEEGDLYIPPEESDQFTPRRPINWLRLVEIILGLAAASFAAAAWRKRRRTS